MSASGPPRRRRLLGRLLMGLGALGTLAIGALLVLSATGARGTGGGTAAPPAGPTPSPTNGRLVVEGPAPPPLVLRPRLLDGSVLGSVTVPGLHSGLSIVEGLGMGAHDLGHDQTTAYPGEPHSMVLLAGSAVTLPALAAGTDLDVVAVYGAYT